MAVHAAFRSCRRQPSTVDPTRADDWRSYQPRYLEPVTVQHHRREACGFRPGSPSRCAKNFDQLDRRGDARIGKKGSANSLVECRGHDHLRRRPGRPSRPDRVASNQPRQHPVRGEGLAVCFPHNMCVESVCVARRLRMRLRAGHHRWLDLFGASGPPRHTANQRSTSGTRRNALSASTRSTRHSSGDISRRRSAQQTPKTYRRVLKRCNRRSPLRNYPIVWPLGS